MNDISDLSEFDPEVKSKTSASHSIDDLSEFEPKEAPKKVEKKQEWWQGLNDDPTWSGLAKRIGIGAVRGGKDVVDTAVHGAGNVAASTAEKILPEQYSKPVRKYVENIKAEDKAGREEYNKEYPSNEGIIPTAGDVGRMGGQIAATLPVMPARAMQAATALLGAAPRAAGVAAPLINRLMGHSVTGAIGGGTLGATTASTNDKSLGENVGEGTLSGGIGGAILGTAASAGKTAGSKIIGAISKETAHLAERAEQLGIQLKGSQVSNSPLIKKIDQMTGMLPFSGQQGITDKQVGQFYKAVSNTFGEDTHNITPQLIKTAKQKIGGDMEAVYKNSTSTVDQHLATDLQTVINNAHATMTDAEIKPIMTQIKNIVSKIDPNGQITGDAYHGLTKYDAVLSKAQQSSNPNIKNAANQIRNAMEDLLDRNLPTAEKEALMRARAKYKAASTVGEWLDQSLGDPNPLNLMRKVNQAPGGKLRSGDLGELADIARKFFPTSKDSGTPLGEAILSNIRALSHNPIGTAASLYYGGAALGAVKAGALLAGNRLAREAINSKFVRNSLVDSALGKTNTGTVKAAQKLAPYAGLPIIRKDEQREPLRITINPK